MLCPYCKPTHPVAVEEVSFGGTIRRKVWNRLDYECPHCILVREFPLVMGLSGLGIAGLRRDSPTKLLERHHGSLLAYGMMNRSRDRIPFEVAFGPEGDLDGEVEDCVLRYRQDGLVSTYPVQLKRVTRDDMDPHDELNLRIAALAAYQVDDLIGGISIERQFLLEWNRIAVPPSRIMELWLIRTGDGITWGLHAFTPSKPGEWKHIEFMYPSVIPENRTEYYSGDTGNSG
jgi:hypothetical protein